MDNDGSSVQQSPLQGEYCLAEDRNASDESTKLSTLFGESRTRTTDPLVLSQTTFPLTSENWYFNPSIMKDILSHHQATTTFCSLKLKFYIIKTERIEFPSCVVKLFTTNITLPAKTVRCIFTNRINFSSSSTWHATPGTQQAPLSPNQHAKADPNTSSEEMFSQKNTVIEVARKKKRHLQWQAEKKGLIPAQIIRAQRSNSSFRPCSLSELSL